MDWQYTFEPQARVVEATYKMVAWLGRYHNHQVVGLEQLPKKGPVLLVSNHSLATYDMPIIAGKVLSERKRLVRCIVDKTVFKVPGLGHWASRVGCVDGNQQEAERLLQEGEVLMVAPGGMKEALKKAKDRYQVQWQGRKGFVRLALKTGAPIVLVACPRADDLLEIYDNKLTELAYNKFRLPLALAKGVGPTMIPRPIRLTHYVSPPQYPPAMDSEDLQAFTRTVDQWHESLECKMQQLMQCHSPCATSQSLLAKAS